MANDEFLKSLKVSAFDIPDIKIGAVDLRPQVNVIAAKIQAEFNAFCKQCMETRPYMDPSLTQYLLNNLNDIASRHVNEYNAKYKQSVYASGHAPDSSMMCQYQYGICDNVNELAFYARVICEGSGNSCAVTWEIPDTPNPYQKEIKEPEKPQNTMPHAEKESPPVETPKYLPQYFTNDQMSKLCKKKTQQWIYSSDAWDHKFQFMSDRETYIMRVMERGGSLCIEPSTNYGSDMNEVLKMCLFDVGDLNSPITWGSRRGQKKFKKCTIKYNMIESIYRRFIKIQNAVLAFYHSCDNHTLGTDFTTVNRFHMKVSLDDFLHVYYEPKTYKEKQVRGIYTWMPQIIPYIRFQLIDILELMGRSYYDFPCIQQADPYEQWEEPLAILYTVAYNQFKVIQKAFNVCETIPLNPNLVLTFLREDIPSASKMLDASVLFRYKNFFYHHNMIETILLIDYLAGTVRSIGYILDHPDIYEKDELNCNLVALGDLYEAIVHVITQYADLDSYIHNGPDEITWHRDLIHCSSFRMASMDVYLADKRSFFKKHAVNPEKLYDHKADYWNSLFVDFETKIRESLS